MYEESGELPAILLCVVFLFAGLICSGCREKKDVCASGIEGMCRYILKNPRFSRRTKDIAKKVLHGWKDDVRDPTPVLIYAGYGLPSDGNDCRLMLVMSDEEFDIAGFKVREVHKTGPSAVTVEESYRIFPDHKIGDHQLLRFRQRETPLQRKNEEDWARYVNLPAKEKLMAYGRREYPDVLLSLPNPPAVEVWISIFDLSGRQSEAVPLEHGPSNTSKPRSRPEQPRLRESDCEDHQRQ